MICITTTLSVNAQKHEILDWDFFKNDRPINAEHQAFTWSKLSYRYKVLKFEGEIAKISFEVFSKVDTANSYFEKARRLQNDTLLLKHEQGHADIVFIYALKLKEAFNKIIFSKQNFKEEVTGIFNGIFLEMRLEQLKYDAESDHSKNKEGQRKWNGYFKEIIDAHYNSNQLSKL